MEHREAEKELHTHGGSQTLRDRTGSEALSLPWKNLGERGIARQEMH